MASERQSHHVDTVVIGGGQAGLVVGNDLRRHGIDFVILDASARVGDAWRKRWDSLRLFTQARMNGLPGMPFPGAGGEFVGKDAVADFLETYARTKRLPVRSGVRVNRLRHDGRGFLVETTDDVYSAENVIVAMADYQKPRVPEFAVDLGPNVVQMHSSEYASPDQLQDGKVLVVGLGNSGADIAYETAKTHATIVSGTEKGAIPFALEGWFGRHFGTRLVRTAMINILNTSTPMGRRVRPKMLQSGPPLVRVRPKELSQAGVERVTRITGVEDGLPVTSDGVSLQVSNVIWCTGYQRGYDWIELPIFDDDLRPKHTRGIVADQPGLYFLGLYFLHSAWSETIPGVQPDARHVVKHLIEHRSPTSGHESATADARLSR
jgi:putative flavoprotein involved in K+ transport